MCAVNSELPIDDLGDEMDNLSLGNGTLEFIVKNFTKERESSDYIKSWANATRGESSVRRPSSDGMTENFVKFEVVSARTVDIASAKKYVAYTIMVRRMGEADDPHPAVIERRYTDFLLLYNSLKKDYPELLQSLHFPKKALIGNFTPEMISTRSAGFEDFLTLISTKKQLKESSAVTNFLQNREILEALKLIGDNQFEQARPLVENNFWLVNKMLTDRAPTVLRCLCLLVAVCARSLEPAQALGIAALAVRRYQAVSDADLLRYYVPLLNTTMELCHRTGREFQTIREHIHDLRQKGINIDPAPSLLSVVLQDIRPLLQGPS